MNFLRQINYNSTKVSENYDENMTVNMYRNQFNYNNIFDLNEAIPPSRLYQNINDAPRGFGYDACIVREEQNKDVRGSENTPKIQVPHYRSVTKKKMEEINSSTSSPFSYTMGIGERVKNNKNKKSNNERKA